MARLSAKLRTTEGGQLTYWCQGCDSSHSIVIAKDGVPHPCWTWDGNVDAPTFSPSVLVTYNGSDAGHDGAPPARCHTVITGGMVKFCGDCSHPLAGQTLPLPYWPYAEGEYGGV